MLLWVALACLTAAVLVAIIHPLAAGRAADRAAASEVDIYRDQLAELEAERARGLVGAAEADAARIEVSRRLLAAAGRVAAEAAPAADPWPTQLRAAALVTALAVPALSLLVYLAQGSPWMPDSPAAQRVAAVESGQAAKAAEIARLVAAVEAELKKRPEDGKGWEAIAPVYMRQQRYKEAADAFANALRLLGPSSRRLAGFAEATVFAANGIVTEPARQAFEELAKLEPARPEPRFWLALAKEQAGNVEAARADYEALLAEAPQDAPWRPLVGERMAAIDARTKGEPAPAEPKRQAARPRELGTEELAAADKMTPDARRNTIDGMVAGLAARLERDGRDAAGWQRLIRAYAVLGELQKAKDALAAARRSLTDDKAALEALATLAKTLGLET